MPAETPARRIQRMLTLVPWLAARPGVTLEETATHFGVTVEALESDLWQVILCGLPGYGPDQLVDIDFWDDGAIFVHDAQTLTVPLRLSPEESSALLLGLRAIAQAPGVEYSQAILTAAAKIENALTPVAVAPEIIASDDVQAGVMATLEDAIRRHTPVELHYGSADHVVSTRTVWPQHVIAIDGITYVSGWCEHAEAVRTFRCERILAAQAVSGRAHPPDVTVDSWWEALAPHRALVQVPRDRRWALEEAASVEIVDESGDVVRATIGFANAEWVASWVLAHAGALTVLEPPWVRAVVAEHADRLLARHPRDDG